MKPTRLHNLLLPLLLGLLTLGVGYGGYWVSYSAGTQSLIEKGQRQLQLQASGVESDISRYTYLPSLLELEKNVTRLLLDPTTYSRRLVNAYLEGLNQRMESRAIYLIDTTGRVLATSNWRDADSYQGEDLSIRAYFQDAMAGRPGRYYGMDSTTGEPGYYLAHGLVSGGEIIGVAVVKVRLEALEERWKKAQLQAFVSDENGIIILSSNPQLRLKAVRPLSPEDKERLARSLQYYWWALNEWQPSSRKNLEDGVEEIGFVDQRDSKAPPKEHLYLSQTHNLRDTPWQFTLLSPLEDLRREAMIYGALAAVAFALLMFLLIAWNERRKMLATRLAAREALEKANAELEHRIAERTADLSDSNTRLLAEVRERKQTEANLRQAQDGLVQAGKLAVIGQMSTSIAHELNQPLAALRTLSANAARFLERGATDTAAGNLQAIGELVDRMGRITGSLRAFARRSGDQGQANLEQAVDAALFLLHSRFEQEHPTLHREVAAAHLAIDQTRLEQILVNLLSNALDAIREQPRRELWLSGATRPGGYRLELRDSGPGIAPEVREHLFEPFFTTKPGEKGLGLGLTLSASLAAAAGGSLAVRHPDEGGTAFILELPCLPVENAADD